MFQQKKTKTPKPQDTLLLSLITIQQSLRDSQSLLTIKKDVSHCSDILFQLENMFETSQYLLVKRVFNCYGVALTRLFEAMERVTAENRALENKGNRLEIAGEILRNLKMQAERVDGKEYFMRRQSGGRSLGGVMAEQAVNKPRRGVSPPSKQQQPQQAQQQQQQQQQTSSISSDFQQILKPSSHSSSTGISLSLTTDQMYHLHAQQPRMSTNTFINHIGAHLNTVRSQIDGRRPKQFREQLTSILEQFQKYQKDVTQFINKQALEMPNISCEADVKSLVEEIMSERAKWRNQAVAQLVKLIQRSKRKIVGMMEVCQEQVERVEEIRKEMEEKMFKGKESREVQTEDKDSENTNASTALMEYFGEQTVILQTTKKLNQQLQQNLTNMQSQFQTTKSQAFNLKQHAILTQKHLQQFQSQIDELQDQIILQQQQKQQLKQKLELVANVDIGAFVQQVGKQHYSQEMKVDLQNILEMLFRQVGLVNGNGNGEAGNTNTTEGSEEGIDGKGIQEEAEEEIKEGKEIEGGGEMKMKMEGSGGNIVVEEEVQEEMENSQKFHRTSLQESTELTKDQNGQVKEVKKIIINKSTKMSPTHSPKKLQNNQQIINVLQPDEPIKQLSPKQISELQTKRKKQKQKSTKLKLKNKSSKPKPKPPIKLPLKKKPLSTTTTKPEPLKKKKLLTQLQILKKLQQKALKQVKQGLQPTQGRSDEAAVDENQDREYSYAAGDHIIIEEECEEEDGSPGNPVQRNTTNVTNVTKQGDTSVERIFSGREGKNRYGDKKKVMKYFKRNTAIARLQNTKQQQNQSSDQFSQPTQQRPTKQRFSVYNQHRPKQISIIRPIALCKPSHPPAHKHTSTQTQSTCTSICIGTDPLPSPLQQKSTQTNSTIQYTLKTLKDNIESTNPNPPSFTRRRTEPLHQTLQIDDKRKYSEYSTMLQREIRQKVEMMYRVESKTQDVSKEMKGKEEYGKETGKDGNGRDNGSLESKVRSTTLNISSMNRSVNTSKKTLAAVASSATKIKSPNHHNLHHHNSQPKKYPNKKQQLSDYTNTLLKDTTFSELRQSDEFRNELQILASSIHTCPRPQGNKINKNHLAEFLQQATQSHIDTCGKRICRHLLRFLERLKQMMEVCNQSKRKTLAVKLQNINQIAEKSSEEREVVMPTYRKQPYYFL